MAVFPPVVVQNDDLTWEDLYHYLYEENAFDNIVISPGPCSPTCPADIGICLQVLLDCWNVPILVVCLGHQALGYVHGAKVVHASEPIHGRLSCNHVLLEDLSSLVMPHYGVQFHPESVATCHGRQIFKSFRKITEDYWLRSRASFLNEQNYTFSERMQMPHVGQLFTDIPKRWQQLNNEDGQLYKHVDNVHCSGMGGMVNLLHPSIDVKDLRLKWKICKSLAGQVGGARNIFTELFGQDKAENTFWLDSSSTEKRRARFSFMGGKGGRLWKQVTFKLVDKSEMAFKGRGFLSVQDAQGSTRHSFLEKGFLDFLKKCFRSSCHFVMIKRIMKDFHLTFMVDILVTSGTT